MYTKLCTQSIVSNDADLSFYDFNYSKTHKIFIYKIWCCVLVNVSLITGVTGAFYDP